MKSIDICIIGAGPAGLFAVFEAGLLKMRCLVIDALPQAGGQLSEIYPKKPIYDIPGYPEIMAEELTEKLLHQIAPFEPEFILGERVEAISRMFGNEFHLLSSAGSIIKCKSIVIAGGLGCFEPRRPAVPQIEKFEGKGIDYFIKDPESYRGKRIIIAGGGDSALDWTIHLANIAARLTLVHRGDTFRGAPDSAQKIHDLAAQGRITLYLKSRIIAVEGSGNLEYVRLLGPEGESKDCADNLIPLFGLTPKLGPMVHWGLNITKNAIPVNVSDYSTDVDGIYAIGDINTYPGKLKLILSGFHEAALAMQSVFKHVYPGEKLNFKYTTVNGINGF